MKLLAPLLRVLCCAFTVVTHVCLFSSLQKLLYLEGCSSSLYKGLPRLNTDCLSFSVRLWLLCNRDAAHPRRPIRELDKGVDAIEPEDLCRQGYCTHRLLVVRLSERRTVVINLVQAWYAGV